MSVLYLNPINEKRAPHGQRQGQHQGHPVQLAQKLDDLWDGGQTIGRTSWAVKVGRKGKLKVGRGVAPTPTPTLRSFPSWGGRRQRRAAVAAAWEKMNLS